MVRGTPYGHLRGVGAIKPLKTSKTLKTKYGGERGIRTLETLLTLTHFPGVLLQPLGHLTAKPFRYFRARTLHKWIIKNNLSYFDRSLNLLPHMTRFSKVVFFRCAPVRIYIQSTTPHIFCVH